MAWMVGWVDNGFLCLRKTGKAILPWNLYVSLGYHNSVNFPSDLLVSKNENLLVQNCYEIRFQCIPDYHFKIST